MAVAGRNEREKLFPNKGSLICPPGKLMIFYKEETEKNELVARPVRRRQGAVPQTHTQIVHRLKAG